VKSPSDKITEGLILMVVIFILLLVSGCVGFSSGSGETTIERAKENCEKVGGEWTSLGCDLTRVAQRCEDALGIPFECAFTAPFTVQRDCVEASGVPWDFGGCSVSVMEEEGS